MFLNRVRLPMQLHSAQFPEERTVFRKANGVTKTLSVIIRKQYDVETDFLPEILHQRLTIALAHDNITWEGDRYLGGVSKDGDYNIQWPDGVLHYPTAKAECKVQATPFDATNSNCQTCQEASQLDLTDDTITGIYGELQEDTDYTWPLADNDTICCYPAVFSLISFNSDYLTSASINPATGILSIHTGTDLISANGLLIGTYRVTCPNGGYDEANIYASFEGTVVGCLAPTDLLIVTENPTSIEFSWAAPFLGAEYYWEIYEGLGPIGSPVQTGNETTEGVVISGLTPNTQYYFQIRTVCYGSVSNYISIGVGTPPESDICGQYQIAFNDGTGLPSNSISFSYRDCNDKLNTTLVYNNSSVIICALQSGPGVPVYIRPAGSGSGWTITYLGPC